MARRSPYSLDELMVRAALPGLPGGDARRKGRALAMRLGVPIPEALAKRCVTHHTRVRLRVKRPAPPTPAVSGDTMRPPPCTYRNLCASGAAARSDACLVSVRAASCSSSTAARRGTSPTQTRPSPRFGQPRLGWCALGRHLLKAPPRQHHLGSWAAPGGIDFAPGGVPAPASRSSRTR